jgi:uncharacterized tellurite resistance protein B-like protein
MRLSSVFFHSAFGFMLAFSRAADAQSVPAASSSVESLSAVDAQRALKERRFYAGSVNGKSSPEWVKALRDFQRWEGLPETGNVDLATSARLTEMGASRSTPSFKANSKPRTLPQPPASRATTTQQAPKVPTSSKPSSQSLSPPSGPKAVGTAPASSLFWFVVLGLPAITYGIWRGVRAGLLSRRRPEAATTALAPLGVAPDPDHRAALNPFLAFNAPAHAESDKVLERRVETYEAALKAIYERLPSLPSDITLEEFTIGELEEPRAPASPRDENIETKRNPLLEPGRTAIWALAGSVVEVQGRPIEGGLFYVGAALPRQYGSGNENCLVNSELKVALHGDRDARLDYWPDYAQLSPSARSAYLEWLSGARNDPDIAVGYVFLYFYGLERRLLLDDPGVEAATLVTEVRRLLSVYGSNHSFHRYATALLEAVAFRAGELEIDPANVISSDLLLSSGFGEVPLALRVALGVRARDGQVIDADLLLAFVMTHPETRIRTPARRALPELRLLFKAAVEKSFPNGPRFPRAGRARRLQLSYRAASGTFEVPIVPKDLGIPDVSGFAEPIMTARRLLDACTNQLDAFSRELGRSEGLKKSLATVARLPIELRMDAARALSGAPLTALAALAAEATLIEPEEFARRLGLAEAVRGDTAQLREWTRWLTAFGYGITADPRFALRRRKEASAFVVFELAEPREALDPPSEEFRATQITVALGVAVALSDGDFDARERDTLEHFINNSPLLCEDDRRRLRAEISLQAAAPFTINELRSRLKQASTDMRADVAAQVIRVATADRQVSPSEVSFIEKIFRQFDLDTSDLYRLLHEAAAGSAPIESAASDRQDARLSNAQPSPIPGNLDLSRLASIRAETANAASMLSAIFEGDDAELSTTQSDLAVSAASPSTHDSDLDQRHYALLLLLIDREHWPREEFERLARSFDLMPGAVRETLNEWALERHDELLLEGDDPIDVNLYALPAELQRVPV